MTGLDDWTGPPPRTKTFERLGRTLIGGDRLPRTPVWVQADLTVGWVPTWRALEVVIANGQRGIDKADPVYGWGARKGFGVRMPPDMIAGHGLAIWELSGGDDGYLCVCPRIVPLAHRDEDATEAPP